MNMGTRHLTVSDKETSRCECCKSASDNVCIFVIDSFRFLWPGKCFIVSVGIINAFAVLFIFSALGVAVIDRRCCLGYLFYFLLVCLLCNIGNSCTCCSNCCDSKS